ncbi:MAG: hypothetical protein FJ020_07010 [Chloroflexi bacterium]|nr:hypothetical protein [Chloroflexota bacterium]
MRLRAIISGLGLACLLMLGVVSSGCASKAGADSAIGKMPWDTDRFVYVDVRALRGDDDLADLYDVWKDSAGPTLTMRGIDRSDVTWAAYGDSLTLLGGKFDLTEIGHELDDKNYADDEYRGVEVWTKPYGNELVALMNNLIIIGGEEPVEETIRVIKEGEDSLGDDNDVADVLKKLPDGTLTEVHTDNWLIDSVLAGYEAVGLSVEKEDDQTLKVTAVVKFDDDEYARDGLVQIEDYLDLQYMHVDVTRDGQYVIGTAEVDIEDAESLFRRG